MKREARYEIRFTRYEKYAMEIKKGIAVSPGIAIAKSLIIDSEDYRIPRRSIMPEQRMAEVQRIRNAFRNAI